jgi:hypothetical protein
LVSLWREEEEKERKEKKRKEEEEKKDISWRKVEGARRGRCLPLTSE